MLDNTPGNAAVASACLGLALSPFRSLDPRNQPVLVLQLELSGSSPTNGMPQRATQVLGTARTMTERSLQRHMAATLRIAIGGFRPLELDQ